MTPFELAERLFQGLLERNGQAVTEVLADKVIWHLPVGLDLDFVGSQAYLDAIASLDQTFDEPLRFTPLKIIASNDSAAVVCRNTARKGDKKLNSQMVFILTIDGAKISEVYEYPQAPEAWIRFWLEDDGNTAGA